MKAKTTYLHKLVLAILAMLLSLSLLPVFSSNAFAEEAAPEQGAAETEMDDGGNAQGITKEEWDAFLPQIKSVPKSLKATKTKRLKTNAPEGVSVEWKVGGKRYASISQKGTLKGKRVGTVYVKAVFTAEIDGKVLKKTAKTANIKIKGKKVIFIDPGHQQYANLEREPRGPGSTLTNMKVSGGCVGCATGIPEYKFTLKVAKKLRTALLKKGYDVVLAREKNNVNISNRERALKANASGADICIRIHADSYVDGSSVRGASLLYADASNPFPVGKLAKKSKKLGKYLLKEYCKATGISSRGLVVRNDLVGLNWSKIPNVLIECGFFSNAQEDRFLNKSKNQDKMVKGMVKGINKYFGY